MVFLRFYLDESYNNRTFNLGGWLAPVEAWDAVERRWKQRIEYERRKHGKFARYHATHCNGRKEDYEGWSDAEILNHTKALLRILITHRPKLYAVCAGIDVKSMLEIYPDDRKDFLAAAYNLTLRQAMMMIGREALGTPSRYKIAIIHDWADKYNAVLSEAFTNLRDDSRWKHRNIFTTIAPIKWRDCVCTQPADLIAFDTFKLLDQTIHSTPHMRKSLQALLGKGVPVLARYINRDTLIALKELHKRNASPQEESAACE